MITLDQTVWNLLFGWMTGKKCLIPEGCPISVGGTVFYIGAILIIILTIKEKDKILKGRESLFHKIRLVLSTLNDLK